MPGGAVFASRTPRWTLAVVARRAALSSLMFYDLRARAGRARGRPGDRHARGRDEREGAQGPDRPCHRPGRRRGGHGAPDGARPRAARAALRRTPATRALLQPEARGHDARARGSSGRDGRRSCEAEAEGERGVSLVEPELAAAGARARARARRRPGRALRRGPPRLRARARRRHGRAAPGRARARRLRARGRRRRHLLRLRRRRCASRTCCGWRARWRRRCAARRASRPR